MERNPEALSPLPARARGVSSLPLFPDERRLVMRQQIGGTVVDLDRTIECLVAPAAGPERDAAHFRFRCGFDVIGSVADHHEIAGRQAALLDGRPYDVWVGLGAFRVAGGSLVLHEVVDF